MALRAVSVAVVVSTACVVSAQDAHFENKILPILKSHCVKCHGVRNRKADLNLEDFAGLLRGGESGHLLNPTAPEESLLLEMVRDRVMPPEEEPQLTDQQIEIVTAWARTAATSAAHLLQPARFDVTYKNIVPLMLRRCVMCHGAELQFGNLDVRQHARMLKGGDSGPALVAGNSEDSLMVRRIVDLKCPPKEDIGESGIEPMTEAELQQLRAWIDGGAQPQELVADIATGKKDAFVTDDDRSFWAFQSPQMITPPPIASDPTLTAIDKFVLRKLKSNNLDFASRADLRTLARRAAFAVTGLPPNESAVSDLLGSSEPDAWSKYVDTLLSSRRYGEKWGRFWLDLAGYADSEGKRSADAVRPFAWRYRDWVIQAFNNDKPYDEFLVEQLAGDELFDWADQENVTEDVVSSLTATGFLRMVPDGTAADPVNRFSDRVEVISDAIDVLSRSVMGLTMNCARCHSHKYDPLPQRDYYRLVAVFKGAYDEYDWLTPHKFGNQWKHSQQRLLQVMTSAESQAHEAEQKQTRERMEEVTRKLMEKGLSAAEKNALKAEQKKLSERLEPPRIRALWDRGQPSPTFIYRRGDETQPGRLVGPGVPSVLTDGTETFQPVALNHSSPKTGRRLAFARWLTSEDHPLTSRVIVNRIWQQHFGRGIVESVDNFGQMGTPPSHPELLDWLSVNFVRQGWSIKQLHRQILNSVVWQQSSLVTEKHRQHDPENRLLSRMPMRRLSAEEIRDTVLLLADRLNEAPYGSPDDVDVRSDGLVTSIPRNGKWRRSIYVRQRRKEMPTFFETFDLPQMNPNCTSRVASTVVNQALHLLNNGMVHELSYAFAERVRQEAGVDRASQLNRAFELAFGRPASKEEFDSLQYAVDSIEQALLTDTETIQGGNRKSGDRSEIEIAALAGVCHSLMNSASLIYVD